MVSPLLAILSITADWQHKDVVKFYALQPRRLVILAAKYVAVTGFSILVVGTACLCGLLVAAALAWVANAPVVYGSFALSLWQVVCAVLVGSVSGAAVASAVLSTPLAIVFVLVQSTVLDLLIGLVPNVPVAYLQSGTFSSFLAEGGDILPALSSAVLWIVIPAAVGARRHVTKDIA
ncbi:hypothetical protein [Sinomonas albida]|uniref:hypothetical protein n=1 Tax=Sinomonas albida TaxID=369942 RepID=UPI003017ED76